MKYFKAIVCGLVVCSVVNAAEPDRETEQKIDRLIGQMTLQEKIGQLSQPVLGDCNDFSSIEAGRVGSFCVGSSPKFTPEVRNRLQKAAVEDSRLGIPIIFGSDVIHGFKTIYPIALGLAASWDLEMAEKTAAMAATEARRYGRDMTFSPMVDVSRDPRWGRISECYGEDVLLNAAFGAATVRGYAGDDLTDPENIGSCVKHYVAYGLSQGGRDKQFTEVSRRSLLDTYLPPFKACVDAGAVSVMTAFNDQSGVPSTANRFTLTEVLRNRWGFDGFVLSDWDAVVELMNHGIAGTETEAAEKAILAGCDMEMKSFTYWNLEESVKAGRVSEAVIDEAVRRVLRMKFRLGLFENPYVDAKKGYEVQLTPEHRKLAREAAAESMVLLKNEKNALPLTGGKVSVIGPWSYSHDMLGWWTGNGSHADVIPVMDGLRAQAPDGLTLMDGTEAKIWTYDTTVVCLGESGKRFGESNCLTDVGLDRSQVEMVKEAKKRSKKVVAVIFNGRPLVLTEIMEHADAVVLAWHPGVEAGNAVADVLFGAVNPCAKVTSSFPKSTGQIPLYYSDRISGRPREDCYLDMDAKPLVPFGFGLSYTEFSYTNLTLSSTVLSDDQPLQVSVDVTNTGKRDGKEIVQLYVHDKVAGVTRPQKELKGFDKIFLKKGETRTVRFTLHADDLAFYDLDCRCVVEPGEFDLWVGSSSVDESQTATFVYK